jgi:N-acetylglucosamine-6-phosphate deacetylase
MKNRIEGIRYDTGEPVIMHLENGIISDIQPKKEALYKPLPFIGPGLVDLQINGYKGLDFNTLPFSCDLVYQASQAVWEEGVTTFLPTVITNSDERITQALSIIAQACEENEEVRQTIAGIHLEGPFLSPEDGPRGAHAKAYVKAPDWDLFQHWQERARGAIKLVTLSPEWPEATRFIANCVKSGVRVSIGHTNATVEQIREAVAAGATLSTHFGNGAHLMLPRHPNYLWEQLAADELWACVIADGFHLPEAVLKVVLRVKGKHTILVSDAVSFAGMSPGEYETHIGGKVVLTAEGKLHLADSPQLLAGSAQMMTWGIRHLVQEGLTVLSEAWDMASLHPSELMGFSTKAGIQIGAPADLVLFTWENGSFDIHETFKQGTRVYQKNKMVEERV